MPSRLHPEMNLSVARVHLGKNRVVVMPLQEQGACTSELSDSGKVETVEQANNQIR